MIPAAMRALWTNDIHLEFLDDRERAEFLRRLAEIECDCLLLGGDIGIAPTILGCLNDIQRTVRKPVYFVLGNHDFYHGSISAVRMAIRELRDSPRWLGRMEFVPLTGGPARPGQCHAHANRYHGHTRQNSPFHADPPHGLRMSASNTFTTPPTTNTNCVPPRTIN